MKDLIVKLEHEKEHDQALADLADAVVRIENGKIEVRA